MNKLNELTEIQLIKIARELDVLKSIERSYHTSGDLRYIVNKPLTLVLTYKEALIIAIKEALK